MLRDILKIIYETRMYSKTNIAKKLNIDEQMVEQAILKLIQMNYLQEEDISPTCSGSCTGCAISNCNKKTVTTYILTDKGLNSLSA